MNPSPSRRSSAVAFFVFCVSSALVIWMLTAFILQSRGVSVITERPTRTPEPTSTVRPVTVAIATDASIPTVTPWVRVGPATVTRQATLPSLAPPPVRRSGNGPDADVSYVANDQVVLDGLVEEWGSGMIPLTLAHFGADAWQGPQDLSGETWLGWNEEYLFVAANVNDEAHVQTQREWEQFRGDSVELWLDTDLMGDFLIAEGNGDDWQFGFSPGDFSTLRPEGVVYVPVRNSLLNRQISVAAKPNANGYTLEARIPWGLLGVTPRHGMFFGYSLDLSDNDVPNTAQQQTQVNQNPNFQFNTPTTFGNLILE